MVGGCPVFPDRLLEVLAGPIPGEHGHRVKGSLSTP